MHFVFGEKCADFNAVYSVNAPTFMFLVHANCMYSLTLL